MNPKPSIMYHPGLCASQIDIPLLMVISPDDEMPGAEVNISRLVLNKVLGPKEWYEVEVGHFGVLYYPSSIFSQASQAEVDFLKKYLS